MGGPIARVRDGDRVTIDVANRRIDVDADLSARSPSQPEREAPVGVFAKYAVLAASASQGAVTIPNPPPARTADSFPGRPRAASTQTAHEDA